jgi:hypothetical protein
MAVRDGLGDGIEGYGNFVPRIAILPPHAGMSINGV